MLLLSVTSRLYSPKPARVIPGAAAERGPVAALVRNIFDLSSTPAGLAALVGRNVVLVAAACVCYCLGAGAAHFIQAAPVLAALAGGAVLAGILCHLLAGD